VLYVTSQANFFGGTKMILRRKFLTAIVLTSVCAATAAFSAATLQGQDTAPQQKATASPHGKLLAAYHGVLPCADCPGIDTTVKFFGADAHATSGLYFIHHAYQERKGSYNETGTWTLEKGMPDDASASVYVLKPKTGSGGTNFLQVSNSEIKQLDNDRKPFGGTTNFSLKRVGR
jgi:copper homeostasis protein (lipoprotein)